MRRSLQHGTILSLAAFASIQQQAGAMYMLSDIKYVPIQRLLTNLQKKEQDVSDPKALAYLEFQIGRLHSMAYALKTDELKVWVDQTHERAPTPEGPIGMLQNLVHTQTPGETVEKPFINPGESDFTQFEVRNSNETFTLKNAKLNLLTAILRLEKATKLDPTLLPAKLGLAWCLEQSGQKSKAIQLYRELLNAAWDSKNFEPPNNVPNWDPDMTTETGRCLRKILDPVKDAKEITNISAICERANMYRAVTPLLIPLAPHLAQSDLMTKTNVVFDLSGSGKRNYASWPSKLAGWLVYDGQGTKQITSGLQLFGQHTFWIFWQNGYEALQSLDDDGNGRLEGRELDGLAIWQDRNCDGISAENEVRPLSACGIQSLSCSKYQETDGILSVENGVTFITGETAPTYDWIVEECSHSSR